MPPRALFVLLLYALGPSPAVATDVSLDLSGSMSRGNSTTEDFKSVIKLSTGGTGDQITVSVTDNYARANHQRIKEDELALFSYESPLSERLIPFPTDGFFGSFGAMREFNLPAGTKESYGAFMGVGYVFFPRWKSFFKFEVGPKSEKLINRSNSDGYVVSHSELGMEIPISSASLTLLGQLDTRRSAGSVLGRDSTSKANAKFNVPFGESNGGACKSSLFLEYDYRHRNLDIPGVVKQDWSVKGGVTAKFSY